MPKKKPLVAEARPGLDSLKDEIRNQFQSAPDSYRARFLSIARRHAASGEPKSPDPAPRPDL